MLLLQYIGQNLEAAMPERQELDEWFRTTIGMNEAK